jgi:succinate dehydrogenase flavin-adding protein (antitoxin of CptAB toxin-antitoxin module)
LSNASEYRRRKYKVNIKSRRGSRKRCNIIEESSDDEEENLTKSSCEENSELLDNVDGSASSSDSESSCDTNEDLAEKLEQKIKDLVFFKIELPSATSNKSIINTLDDIEGIIREIKHDCLHEVKKMTFIM